MNSFFHSLRRFIVLAALVAHVAGSGLHALEHASHAEPAPAGCSDACDGHFHEGAELSHAPVHDCVQCQRSSGSAPVLQVAAMSWQTAPSGAAAPSTSHLLSALFLPAAPRRGPPIA